MKFTYFLTGRASGISDFVSPFILALTPDFSDTIFKVLFGWKGVIKMDQTIFVVLIGAQGFLSLLLPDHFYCL